MLVRVREKCYFLLDLIDRNMSFSFHVTVSIINLCYEFYRLFGSV